MDNLLKKRLRAGEQTAGLWISTPSLDVTELLSTFGFDWFVFDNEHSPLDVAATQSLMQAMRGNYTVPLIRVPWNDLVAIKKSLDIGPYGLIIPWINTKEEAARAVEACKYPGEGLRGYGPGRPSYLDPNYVETANRELLIMLQIESQKAVDNLEDILAVEGVDGFYIGPMDLSASLGYLENPFAPKVQETIAKILDVGRASGVITGIHGLGLEDAINRIKQGFQFVCAGSDLEILIEATKNTIMELRKVGIKSHFRI